MSRFVYFIRAGEDGPIKIGSSADPVARLAGLQTGHYARLRLLVVMPEAEDGRIERLLHERFAGQRLSGEWFDLRADQLDLVLEIVEEALFRYFSGQGAPEIRRRVAERVLASEAVA